MGERLNGIQEVTGSIPVFSTNIQEETLVTRLFLEASFFMRRSAEYQFQD